MSGSHFHVHGPHDHAVEHGAHGGDSFAGQIAVMTAVLSTVGAFFSYEGGATQNEAMLHKNNAAIKKTEASNQWNYYQAKSNKQNLAELAVALNSGSNKEKYEQEVERYKTEKQDIKKKAEALEAESHAEDEKSDASMHLHHRWAQAMTAIQVAISLAAITLLTRKRWLHLACYGAAGVGTVLGALALVHI
jgi:phage-related minor tail protein